jgi:PAS domain S-box-containing protein
MKTVRFRAPVTIATFISLLVLTVTLLMLGRSIRNDREAWRWVVHTREVLEHVQTTLTLTSDAEAAQRGFLLTRNDAFATAFAEARAAIPQEIQTLRRLTADNPRQQAMLPSLETLLRARLAMLADVMARQAAGTAPDTATLEAGRQLKQRIVEQANGIRAEEQRLLVERQRWTAIARRDLVVAMSAAATLSIFLVVLLWVLSTRDAARLLSEQAQLDTTLRSIGDGVVTIDAGGNVRLVNPVAEALTGMRESAAIGKPLTDLLHLRDESTGAAPELAAALAGPRRTWVLPGRGRDYVVELTASPIQPPRGSVEGTVLVIRDVTERTMRERALAESEANYRYTIELNPQIPWKAAPDGSILAVSERWLALTDQSREDVIGAGWGDVVYAEDLPAMTRAWMDAVASRRPYAFEHRVHVGAGLRWMRSSAAPRLDEHGAVVAWYGLTEDIHARKEAELAVLSREAELADRLSQIETIYRAVPVGLGYVDADLRLLELNDALAEITGRPKAANTGAPLAAVLPAPLGEGIGVLLERVARERRQVGAIELSDTSAASGTQRDLLGSVYPVLDGDRLQGIVVALLEVTQLKAAQRELIDANQSLEQRIEERTARIAEANAELRAFAHTVAHDLRAPLRNVEGFATALLEDEAERMSDDGKMFTERIVAAVIRMDRLITDLLAYSRLSRAEIRLERVDTGSVVRTVLRDLESQVAASGAVVTVAPALPAVLANQAMLVQVVANLVSNAIKFVAKGVVPRVDIDGRRDGALVRLLIEDNGIGIAPEHYDHVFGVFERLHGQEEYPGTGIGLAIVRKGIERMGGSVRIFARTGGGTGFELVLEAA